MELSWNALFGFVKLRRKNLHRSDRMNVSEFKDLERVILERFLRILPNITISVNP